MHARDALRQCRLIFSTGEQSVRPMSFGQLKDHGLTRDILRWLMFNGWADHVSAKTGKRTDSLRFGDGSCIVLTDAGSRIVGDPDALTEADNVPIPDVLKPSYDKENRVLYWGCHVIKQFIHPADNQEWILLSFEELGWPQWLDDPLPRKPNQNPKKVLKQTVCRLNSNRQASFIHFKTRLGMLVGWEHG